MSDLRETLVRRFGQVLDAYYGGPGFEPKLRKYCADECIRQMEWAMQEGIQKGWAAPLTAAPEGWEVPK